MNIKKYQKPISTFIWGVVGIVVSLYMINSPIKTFGQILFVLSILMFVLAIFQAFKVKN